MIERWKKLAELDCVKEFGLGHRVAHFLGIHMFSRCVSSFFKKVEE